MVVRMAPAELPASWRHASHGVILMALGGEEAVLRPAVLTYVARQMAANIPVFLSAASPSILLNEHLDAGDRSQMADRLKALYGLLHDARWERGPLRMIPFLYRLQLDRYRRKMLRNQ